MKTDNEVRPAAVAGMFYAGEKKALQADVGKLLREAARVTGEGSLVGLIVPHAGHMYSGATAADAFALLEGRDVGTCIVVGPSHQEYFHGVSVYPGSAYSTPLGPVEIDTELRDALLTGSHVVHASLQGHRREHSLEVQLPFLQSVLPETKILPLIMGDQSAASCFALGEALASAARDLPVLLIASSDLSHFHSSSEARALDGRVLELIKQYRVRELMDQLETELCEACGGGPIVAVMTAAQLLGAHRASILHSCNSGDITGDTDRVVGYCSAALWKDP